MALQNLRSNTANKRPDPDNMVDGQLAVNFHPSSPGLFFRDNDTTKNLIKVGPVHVGTSAPNSTPATGGETGNSVGEQWLDTTGGNYDLKIWDGSAWRSLGGGTDAATLDGLDSTQFVRSDAADAKTSGDLTFNNNIKIVLGSTKDSELYCDGTNLFLDLDGGSDFFIRDVSTLRYTFSNSGNFTATGNVTAYSDINLKENIQVIPDALDKVSQLRGVTYNRKDQEGPRQSGVIAQEVEAVLPEVVLTNEDGIKSVAYGNLVGLLIESTKELKAEVEQLKQERS